VNCARHVSAQAIDHNTNDRDECCQADKELMTDEHNKHASEFMQAVKVRLCKGSSRRSFGSDKVPDVILPACDRFRLFVRVWNKIPNAFYRGTGRFPPSRILSRFLTDRSPSAVVTTIRLLSGTLGNITRTPSITNEPLTVSPAFRIMAPLSGT
jgi:hypothetical protein